MLGWESGTERNKPQNGSQEFGREDQHTHFRIKRDKRATAGNGIVSLISSGATNTRTTCAADLFVGTPLKWYAVLWDQIRAVQGLQHTSAGGPLGPTPVPCHSSCLLW